MFYRLVEPYAINYSRKPPGKLETLFYNPQQPLEHNTISVKCLEP